MLHHLATASCSYQEGHHLAAATKRGSAAWPPMRQPGMRARPRPPMHAVAVVRREQGRSSRGCPPPPPRLANRHGRPPRPNTCQTARTIQRLHAHDADADTAEGSHPAARLPTQGPPAAARCACAALLCAAGGGRCAAQRGRQAGAGGAWGVGRMSEGGGRPERMAAAERGLCNGRRHWLLRMCTCHASVASKPSQVTHQADSRKIRLPRFPRLCEGWGRLVAPHHPPTHACMRKCCPTSSGNPLPPPPRLPPTPSQYFMWVVDWLS